MTYPTPEEARALMRPDEACIIGVDPGDSTGIYALWSGADGFPDVHFETLAYGGVISRFTFEFYHGIFVVESFITRPSNFAKSQLAGKVCGVVDLYAAQKGLRTLYQTPSNIKTMLPDTKALKAAGWNWNTPHECDALRHVLYYLLKR